MDKKHRQYAKLLDLAKLDEQTGIARKRRKKLANFGMM